MNLFGRRDPEPSPSQRRQDTLARILEAQQIAGALTYHIKPSDIGAAKFDFMVKDRLIPYGVIWC